MHLKEAMLTVFGIGIGIAYALPWLWWISRIRLHCPANARTPLAARAIRRYAGDTKKKNPARPV